MGVGVPPPLQPGREFVVFRVSRKKTTECRYLVSLLYIECYVPEGMLFRAVSAVCAGRKNDRPSVPSQPIGKSSRRY